jgi:hypothetical protein
MPRRAACVAWRSTLRAFWTSRPARSTAAAWRPSRSRRAKDDESAVSGRVCPRSRPLHRPSPSRPCSAPAAGCREPGLGTAVGEADQARLSVRGIGRTGPSGNRLRQLRHSEQLRAAAACRAKQHSATRPGRLFVLVQSERELGAGGDARFTPARTSWDMVSQMSIHPGRSGIATRFKGCSRCFSRRPSW